MTEAELLALEARLNKMHQQIQGDIGTLKGLIREAHESAQDLVRVIKDAHKTQSEVASTVVGTTQQMIQIAVERGLEMYNERIMGEIERATEAISSRFDKLGKIMLRPMKRDSMENMIEGMKEAQGRAFTVREVAPFYRETGDTDG